MLPSGSVTQQAAGGVCAGFERVPCMTVTCTPGYERQPEVFGDLAKTRLNQGGQKKRQREKLMDYH